MKKRTTSIVLTFISLSLLNLPAGGCPIDDDPHTQDKPALTFTLNDLETNKVNAALSIIDNGLRPGSQIEFEKHRYIVTKSEYYEITDDFNGWLPSIAQEPAEEFRNLMRNGIASEQWHSFHLYFSEFSPGLQGVSYPPFRLGIIYRDINSRHINLTIDLKAH